ncbi:MAG: phosphotransferase [Marmoricola sp.]
MSDRRLDGGHDGGAELVDGTVRRTVGSWTSSVHLLLAHLAESGFSGAPRALGTDEHGREVLTFLDGQTAGSTLPWPHWVHSDKALTQVANWLRRYHDAVADFVPPGGAVWREGGAWQPGLAIAHNDAAPYNAVWNHSGLVGFVDWDMAGPRTREADVAWMAFSWVPLHARSVVVAEGFRAFASRRSRLEAFLSTYGWEGSIEAAIGLVAAGIQDQVRTMRETAIVGDQAYVRMLELGRDKGLQSALDELADL